MQEQCEAATDSADVLAAKVELAHTKVPYSAAATSPLAASVASRFIEQAELSLAHAEAGVEGEAPPDYEDGDVGEDGDDTDSRGFAEDEVCGCLPLLICGVNLCCVCSLEVHRVGCAVERLPMWGMLMPLGGVTTAPCNLHCLWIYVMCCYRAASAPNRFQVAVSRRQCDVLIVQGDVEGGSTDGDEEEQGKRANRNLIIAPIVVAACLLCAACAAGVCWRKRMHERHDSKEQFKLPDGSDSSAVGMCGDGGKSDGEDRKGDPPALSHHALHSEENGPSWSHPMFADCDKAVASDVCISSYALGPMLEDASPCPSQHTLCFGFCVSYLSVRHVCMYDVPECQFRCQHSGKRTFSFVLLSCRQQRQQPRPRHPMDHPRSLLRSWRSTHMPLWCMHRMHHTLQQRLVQCSARPTGRPLLSSLRCPKCHCSPTEHLSIQCLQGVR